MNFLVYQIKNVVNNKVYIGVTTGSIEKRFKEHLYEAKRGSRRCKLYNAIRKHGKENFIIEILCYCCSKEEMFNKEVEMIKELNSIENGYNMTEGGENPPTNLGKIRIKHSEWMKVNNPMFSDIARKNHEKVINSIKWRSKRKEVLKKTKTPEARRKQGISISGENNPNKRKEVADKKAKKYILLSPQGKEFQILNLNRFCKENNLNCANMILVAQGKRKQHKGWKCSYVN